MIRYDRFRKGGVVSVWVGNFSSEAELDEYLNLNLEFERDFNFELNERDTPEASVKAEAVAISQLVNGFSWSNLYAEEVARIAEERGVKSATTMVIFFNFEYDPQVAKPNVAAPLQFLAAVSFS